MASASSSAAPVDKRKGLAIHKSGDGNNASSSAAPILLGTGLAIDKPGDSDSENVIYTNGDDQPSTNPPQGGDPPPNHGDGPPCCPFTITVANFVTAKLHGNKSNNNYKSWKLQILCLVDSQGLGPHLLEDDPQLPNNQAWNRTDLLLKGWILGALSDEIVKSVYNQGTARQVWAELERMFALPRRPVLEPYDPNAVERDLHAQVYDAAMRGADVESLQILRVHRDYINASVAFTLETPLHVAVAAGRSGTVVQNLVDQIVLGRNQEDFNILLGLKDHLGLTPLHVAALTGNFDAAGVLVQKLSALLYIPDREGLFPVHLAAKSGHRGTLSLLIRSNAAPAVPDAHPNPLTGENGLRLLNYMIDSDFLDMASRLIDDHSELASLNPDTHVTAHPALEKMAYRSTTFCVDEFDNFWKQFRYNWTTCDMAAEEIKNRNADLLNQVPRRSWILEKKLLHEQAVSLVTKICRLMKTSRHQDVEPIYRDAMLKASIFDIHEVIEAIVEAFPFALQCDDGSGQNFLHLAVRYRSQNVYNLIYRANSHKYHYINAMDNSGNSILHMAALLAPPRKLDTVSCPALQMQSELKWFEEVEKAVSVYIRERPNHAGKKPSTFFRSEHGNLKTEGEKWMKDTASSFSIAAALIATVVFATAITLPGGNIERTGYPMRSKQTAFTAFTVFDVASLFTSVTALLMFLSIHSSRFAQDDFRTTLPRILCIGLLTLILSIMLMMATFASAVCVVFGHGHKKTWVVIVAALAPVPPVVLFLIFQMRVLYNAISSTWGGTIFGKQSNDPFH